MELDGDKLLENALRDGVRESIKARLSQSYNNPLDKIISESLSKQSGEFREMLEKSIASCVNDRLFREEIASAVRHSLAKTLIQRFGGEMEKQVNVLKSDPTTRARITLAIEEIVKTQGK